MEVFRLKIIEHKYNFLTRRFQKLEVNNLSNIIIF